MIRLCSAMIVCIAAELFLATAHAQTPCTVPDFCMPGASFFSNQSDSRFGQAASLKNELAIVGAYRDLSCGNSWSTCGAAYVYRYSGTWELEAKLVAPDLPSGAFGSAVAITDQWALASDPWASCAEGPGCGAVYVFQNSGTQWDHLVKLVPADLQGEDNFGRSIALEGNWMAVGAQEAVYLFEFTGATWVQRQKLEPISQGSITLFGEHLGMNSGRLVVSARLTRQSEQGHGAVYFYRLSAGSWVPDGFFLGSMGDWLGSSVALSADYALSVAGGYDCEGLPDCGAAYRYRRVANSWILDDIMTIANPGANEFANQSPAAVMDDWIILGQSSHVFYRNSNNTWSEVGRLGSLGSFVGWSGNPSIDGSNVLIGGPGAAFIFDLSRMTSDCDCDGQSDSCDAALDGIGDCQGNNVVDSCDIYSGLSLDCGGDRIPDECQSDCQSNGIEDSCDIAAGSEDCNANTKPDECELSYLDCNSNGRPDDCDTNNETAIPDECACISTNAAQPDASAIVKNRFISFVPGNPGHWKAIRVTLVSLHHVNPPYTGAPSVPFSAHEGRALWVGPPSTYVESSSNATQFYASTLQCAPHFQDWSDIEVLHVTGSAIVPSSTYDVQFMGANCNLNVPGSYSAPLTVQTGRWGDVIQPFASAGAAGQPDFGDVSGMVNKFRSAPGAPNKVQAKLSSGQSTGELNLVSNVGFESISAAVDAFRGTAYPYTIASCP